MEIIFDRSTTHLTIRLTGSYAEGVPAEILHDIRDEILGAEVKRLLIYTIDVEEIPDLFQRHDLGKEAARIIRGKFRVALVERKDRIDKFLETSITNRGGNFRTFAEEEPAREWLLADEPEL